MEDAGAHATNVGVTLESNEGKGSEKGLGGGSPTGIDYSIESKIGQLEAREVVGKWSLGRKNKAG